MKKFRFSVVFFAIFLLLTTTLVYSEAVEKKIVERLEKGRLFTQKL